MASYLTQRYGLSDQFITFGEQVLVPEPNTSMLLGIGLLTLLSSLLNRRRKNSS
ncbi:MAG: PEP-CTERM sorting domain-containing protein [Thermoguttaceae bacterium]|jgi:hypothetical protein|nr:PEP-CTERM sorting domain-containing protein [Thermoguttaceae bacterium]